MRVRHLVAIAAICAAGSAVAAGSAQEAKQAEMEAYIAKHGALPAATGPKTRKVDVLKQGIRNVPVGIIYDDGIVTATPTMSSFAYGNQFDSASGMAVKSFSVTMQSFFMVSGAGTDNVFISVFGGPGGGTTAPVLTSVSVPLNNGSNAFNTFTFGSPLVGSGSFLAGVWYIGGDTVGLGSGTVNGQGHHGMLINDIAGTGFATLPGLNALVGASTANVVPVELIDFSLGE